MLKQLTLLQTASALALVLALPVLAQDAATDAPAADAQATGEAATGDAATVVPEGETTNEQATEAPAEGATAEAGPEAETEAPAPTADVTRDTVVASVNGTDITLGEVLVAARQLPPQYQQLPPDVLFGGVVDQLIQQELLAQNAPTPSAATEIAIANQRRALLANEVLGGIAESAVTDEAVQSAYDAQFANVEPATEWNASHILVATEEEARAVLERLNAGEEFAAVAQEVSTDTGSGAQGGELGWFGPGMMVPEFETGVAGLQPGQTSEPIESQFGWHVIRLNETRPQEPPALDQVRGEIEGQLQQQAIEARLQELEAGAEVTRSEPGRFDPAVLNDATLLED